jgi:hypothetical protein
LHCGAPSVLVGHTGFWGGNGTGWQYDLMLVLMNLVILVAHGERWVLMK